MGKVIQNAGGLIDGYMMGFTINAVILIVSGLLGLLLLWPNTERARLMRPSRRSRSLREGGGAGGAQHSASPADRSDHLVDLRFLAVDGGIGAKQWAFHRAVADAR